MSIERAPSASWRFIQNGELGRQKWKWLRTAVGGPITSRDFPSYAAAVMDAVSKGFRPKSEPYLVESPGRLVRFEPGRRPVTVWLPVSRQDAGVAKGEGLRDAGTDADGAAAGRRVAVTRRG